MAPRQKQIRSDGSWVVVGLVVVVVVVIYLYWKPVEENSKRYEYKNIYNIVCAFPNLHHANKALTEVQNL